jgi:hypothetical protein
MGHPGEAGAEGTIIPGMGHPGEAGAEGTVLPVHALPGAGSGSGIGHWTHVVRGLVGYPGRLSDLCHRLPHPESGALRSCRRNTPPLESGWPGSSTATQAPGSINTRPMRPSACCAPCMTKTSSVFARTSGRPRRAGPPLLTAQGALRARHGPPACWQPGTGAPSAGAMARRERARHPAMPTRKSWVRRASVAVEPGRGLP